MKLSKATIAVIKNFASINSNIMFRAGNTINVISPQRNVYAEAQTEETFDVDFGVYDLNEFLSVISIFNDPELTFETKCVTISEGRNRVRYMGADANVLILPKNNTPKFPADFDASFELSAANLAQVTRASSILKVDFMSITGDGEKITLIVTDTANPNSNNFSIEVGETDRVFNAIVKTDYLKMMPDDYEVYISAERRGCKIIGKDKYYLIGFEMGSTFS